MDNQTNKNPMSFIIYFLGLGIIVAGILTMALYHDMSWQSYVVIGVIMLIDLWVILKTYFKRKKNL